MVEALCTSGNHERLKCGVHGAAGVLAAVMAAYNIAACCYRRDAHLRVNAVIYTLAIAWEVKQTLHHLQRTMPPGAMMSSVVAMPLLCAVERVAASGDEEPALPDKIAS